MPIFVCNNSQLGLTYIYVYWRQRPSLSTWTPLLSNSMVQFILPVQRGLFCRCSPTKTNKITLLSTCGIWNIKQLFATIRNVHFVDRCIWNVLVHKNAKLGFRCIIEINLTYIQTFHTFLLISIHHRWLNIKRKMYFHSFQKTTN